MGNRRRMAVMAAAVSAVVLMSAGLALAAKPAAASAPAAAKPPARKTWPFQVQARRRSFDQRISPHARLHVLATGFGFTEGPVWTPRGYVYVSDELQNRIYRISPSGQKSVFTALGDPDGNTYNRRHQFVDCASDLRAVLLVRPNGTYRILANRYHGRRLNTPNDIVLGPDGALYFTDPTLDLTKSMKKELPFQGVYRLGSHGRLRLLTKVFTQPNGVAFSPDGRRMYINDTAQRNIRVFRFHAGRISHGRIFGVEPLRPGGPGGVPDGMKVDRRGDIWVAGPGGIWVWNAAGQHLGTIQFPHGATNFAWGGPGYSTLYVAAGHTVFTLRTKVHGFVPWVTGYARRGRR